MVVIDTGIKVSVCSLQQAKKWKLIDKMFPSNIKLKPFNSDPIKNEGQAICAVIFGSSSNVKWHIISAECKPILGGSSAVSLGIITSNYKQGILAPTQMTDTDLNSEIQSCLARYTYNFQNIGKLKNHQIKFHVNP